jgi:predicted nucleic acid-binding protein
MNVIDSSAWLSYFAGDDNAINFADAIEDNENLIVPSITLTEVFKVVCRQSDENNALIVIAHMQQGNVIALDEELSLSAGRFGLKYKLPLADSIIYATAYKHNAEIWTQDADFKNLAKVNYFTKI